MNSIIEVSISGTNFLFYNNLLPEQLTQLQLLSKQFRQQIKTLKHIDAHLIVNQFVSYAEQQLQIKLCSVSIKSVIILK